MPNLWKPGVLLALTGALLLGVALAPAGADEDDDVSLEHLATELAKVKVTLSAACDAAAKAAKGQAFAAQLEVEDDAVLYEVYVLVPGTPPKLFEVEIDAVTGKVIEIEEEDLDDEDDDDDEEEEDEDD